MTEPKVRRQRRKVLTDRMIAGLPRKANRYFYPDPELPLNGIRVRPDGPPHDYYIYPLDPYKKRKWTCVGSTAAIPIAQEREIARLMIRRIQQGLPAREPPPAKPDSFKSVTENWIKRYVAKQQLITQPEIERCMRVYVYPHWETRVFVSLGRSDLAKLLDYIEDHHGRRMADVVAGYVRGVGNWYSDRSDHYVNPFLRHRARVPKGSGKRARILDDDELRRIWLACEQAGAFGAFVQLLLLTAQRRGAVARMRWSDLSPDGIWTISSAPREKANAGALQLPRLAMKIVSAQPRFASNPYVFGGRDAGPIVRFSHRHAVFKAQCGVGDWVLHDCRRTARSLMSRAGVSSEHAERVMGHAIPGIEGIYDRHAYFDEKRIALEKLASLIERIVNPPEGNVVVPIHAPAAVQP